jgi:hypothetical protein
MAAPLSKVTENIRMMVLLAIFVVQVDLLLDYFDTHLPKIVIWWVIIWTYIVLAMEAGLVDRLSGMCTCVLWLLLCLFFSCRDIYWEVAWVHATTLLSCVGEAYQSGSEDDEQEEKKSGYVELKC